MGSIIYLILKKMTDLKHPTLLTMPETDNIVTSP